MKKRKTPIIIFTIVFVLTLLVIPVFAYDWPQENVDADKFYSFFGQKRANTISPSLIFAESEVARSTDEGEISVIITEHNDGFNWFESTLGTAVVVNHEDSLSTVYGNLDTDDLNPKLFENPTIANGQVFASTGNSAWQTDDSYLEFQIIDTKNENYVNPLILMPRIPQNEQLTISGVVLINKFGGIFNLDNQRNIPSGVYKIYKNRQDKAVPYRTSVLVNGSESERINYDTIGQRESELTIQGRNEYDVSELYPDDNLLLLGEIYLPNGNNTVSLIITDFTGKEYSRVFNLTIY